MTQILNTHREKRKRIFLSLFFLQTNKNKTSIGGIFSTTNFKNGVFNSTCFINRVVEGGLQEMEEEGVLRGQTEIRRKLLVLTIVQLSAFKL